MTTQTNNRMTAAYQRAVDAFVQREVHLCVSSLASNLQKAVEAFPEYEEELHDSAYGLPDYSHNRNR